MKKIIFFVIPILLFSFSCKKEEQTPAVETADYPTIKPSSYFPAHPGSYWVYDNGDTLQSLDYELYSYNAAGYTAESDYRSVNIPKLKLQGIYNSPDVYGYLMGYYLSFKAVNSQQNPPFQELLSTKEKKELVVGSYWSGHYIKGRVTKVDTSITVLETKYSNVIEVIRFDDYWSGYGVSEMGCAFRREYYAKDVGLIRRDEKSYPEETDFTTVLRLAKYWISE